MFNYLTRFLAPLALFTLRFVEGTSTPKLPIVDLGYELHQASSFNVSSFNCSPIPLSPNYVQPEGGFYNFSNIRYAEPPVGELRFRAPVPLRNRSRAIDQGKIGRICPQADTSWSAIAAQFIPLYLAGKAFNPSAFQATLANISSRLPAPQDPRASEDCLFLDIVVPQKVFEQAAPHRTPSAPVLLWIHGGGYTAGEKSGDLYNPAGLIKTSQSSNSTGLVYVAINYRVSLPTKLGASISLTSSD